MNGNEHHELINELVAHSNFPGGNVCLIDGVRVDFDNGFGLARASNTTPTVILRFEAASEDELERIKELFRGQLLALRPDITLPF